MKNELNFLNVHKLMEKDLIFNIYTRLLPPYGLRLLRKASKNLKYITGQTRNFLDLGCGNSSPDKFYIIFKKSMKYFGVDREEYDMRKFDKKEMNYFILDLEQTKLKSLFTNVKFGMINFSHVIEHLDNGKDVIMQLRDLQPAGGLLYIETPSEESVYFHHKNVKGTLNFYDDLTHKKVYPLGGIISVLTNCNYKILKCGKRRDIRRILFYLFPDIIFTLLKIPVDGAMLWDIKGFASFVLCKAI